MGKSRLRENLRGLDSSSVRARTVKQRAPIDVKCALVEDFPIFVSAHSTADGGQPYCAILGRDVPKAFTMTYDGRTGVVSLTTE